MKTLWFVALASAPLAILTARNALDFGAVGDSLPGDAALEASALATLEKQAATAAAFREEVDSLKQLDLPFGDSLPVLDNLRPNSPLSPVKRSLAAWNTALGIVAAFLRVATVHADDDLAHLRASEARWENFAQQVESAKLAGSDAMAWLATQRLGQIRRELARRKAEAEASQAAESVKKLFVSGNYQACWTQAQQWLETHAPWATSSRVEEIKALAVRAEFYAEHERLQARLKPGLSSAEREAVLAAFVERFGGAASLADSERLILQHNRKALEKLRAESAAAAQRRAADELLRVKLADLPAGWEERLALAARILEELPSASVQNVLCDRVRQWLEEFLPEKQVDEPPGLYEAQTNGGRVLRGYFRKVLTPDGLVGYKRYDTAAQRDRPTADVGTWLARDLALLPGASFPRRLVQVYQEARKKLLDEPSRRASWEEFATTCERLQAECDAYRVKPGAAEHVPSFHSEAKFARRTASGPALAQLQAIWETARD